MELYHEIRTDAFVIILTGSIDGNNAGELDIAFHRAIKSQKEKIIVDCYKLAFISSAGIGIFLSNLPAIRERGILLTFEGMNAKARRIFHILGLDSLLSISDSSLVA